jgi:hypothetical protein
MDVFGEMQGPLRAALLAGASAAADELPLWDRLAGSPRATARALADALGLEEHRLEALLGVLSLAGAVEAVPDAGGALRYSLVRRPAPAAPLPAGFLVWGQLAEVMRRRRPMEDDGLGGRAGEALRRFHDYLCTAGAEAAVELMAPLAQAEPGLLLDLGSGAGAYSRAYLAAAPEGRAVLVDRPAVLELAQPLVAAFGDRVRLLPAELPDAELPPARVALCANLFHLFGPGEVRRLLRAAARAVAPRGLVVVKDLRMDDDRRGPATSLLFSLNMAFFTEGGRVHTTGALRGMLAEAGVGDLRERRLGCSPDAIVLVGRAG